MKQSTIATIIFMAAMNTALAGEASARRTDGGSGFPRETIRHFPGGYVSRTFARDDGQYGLVVANRNSGTVEHYVIDPRTGMVTVGPMSSDASIAA